MQSQIIISCARKAVNGGAGLIGKKVKFQELQQLSKDCILDKVRICLR